ncbi:hypothetical protein [Arthrobacter sp. D3-16]
MDEVDAGTRPPGVDGHGFNANANANADADVYFPGEPGVVYVRRSGLWCRYERSGSLSEADTKGELNGGNGSAQECAPESRNPHWPGYYSGSSQELIRERRPRVYYDPHQHPERFVCAKGESPTLPLPVLELNGHQEDPEPWLDPTTGNRFTCDQARTPTAILRYAPRKDLSLDAR